MSEEFFDIYDENGKPLGITKPRSEVHAIGDWHKAVHVWIVNSKNELLIQKRAATKLSHPNLWDISSAGHVSAGETPEASASRELEEELGVKISPSELKYLFTTKESSIQYGGKYMDNEFQLSYLVHKDLSMDDLLLQKEEVAEVAWMPLSKLKELAKGEIVGFVNHTEEYKKLYEILK